MAAIALWCLTGRALRWRPPAFLFVAVVVTLVFFVAAEAAGVVLCNAGAFLAISMLYSLGEVGTGDAVSRLMEAYGKLDHPRVRRAIVEALGTARRKEAAEFLDKVLHDPNESYYVRAEAARALGKIKWEFAEHSLKKALEYPSHLDVIRRGALEGLAELGTDEALKIVLRCTEPNMPTPVRVTAVQSLAKSTSPSSPATSL